MVIVIVLQRLHQRVGGYVAISLLVFQQFLLLLVQSVFDEENLRHFDVAIAGSRVAVSRCRHEYVFRDGDEKKHKKKIGKYQE